jgi:hypothetical protein
MTDNDATTRAVDRPVDQKAGDLEAQLAEVRALVERLERGAGVNVVRLRGRRAK